MPNPHSPHYMKECGCLYTKGQHKPWHICPDHFMISIPEKAQHKDYWLYALELEDNNYYIGITGKKDPYDRIRNHGTFYGARWTELHKPVRVLKLKNIGALSLQEAEKQEHALTLRYIQKHGHKRVRGGRLTYSGNYYKIGPWFIRNYQLENFLAGTLLIVLSTYILLHYL